MKSPKNFPRHRRNVVKSPKFFPRHRRNEQICQKGSNPDLGLIMVVFATWVGARVFHISTTTCPHSHHTATARAVCKNCGPTAVCASGDRPRRVPCFIIRRCTRHMLARSTGALRPLARRQHGPMAAVTQELRRSMKVCVPCRPGSHLPQGTPGGGMSPRGIYGLANVHLCDAPVVAGDGRREACD